MTKWQRMLLLAAGAALAVPRPATAALAYSRTESFEQPTIGSRARQAERTFFYAEFLNKYGMFANYLHYWIDRPLFWSRATRPEKFAYETPESFAIHGAQLRKAGLDGLDVFVSARRASDMQMLDDWFVQAGMPYLNIVPIVSYGEAVDRKGPDVKGFAAALRQMQASARATRINGKVLVPTYNYRMFTAAQHRQMHADLVAELGNDDFILCGDINTRLLDRLRKAYRANGRLSPAETQELEQAYREILDTVGGIQVQEAAEKIRKPAGQYCSYYDLSFFRACQMPVLEKLYAQPEYRQKVLGFYVNQGYINHMSGHDHSEEGTGTLREALFTLLKLNPDYLICFEWNEVNENTMFQPTVWGGQVAGRILRWYSRFMKGLAPDPYPGDDTSVPPLALTYPAVVKSGALLHFEILNVPDGVWTEKLRVQLELCDIDGRVVETFPPETIDATKIGSVDYRLPTVSFRGGLVLVPALRVNGRRYAGFSPLRVDPTVCWNYKTVRQGLRDLLAPSVDAVSVTARGEGRFAFALAADFGEPLTSVELIENENEQTACGIEGEYDFASNVILRVAFTTPAGVSVRDRPFTLAVDGAKGCRFLPLWLANVNHGTMRPLKDREGVRVNTLLWSQEVAWFVQVPKAELAAAQLQVAIEKDPAYRPASFSVAALARDGVAAAVLGPTNGVRVEVRRVFDLPDLPPPLNSARVDWRGETETRTRNPVYHFRAIAASGRIWRSRPFRPEPIGGAEVEIPVWDEVAERPAKAKALDGLVPKLVYRFNPESGAALGNTWEPFYNAQLGGGFYYCEAYSGWKAIKTGNRAPAWERDGDSWCLRFDGENDYINFARESLPQGAFTLAMELKPEIRPGEQMVVFRHFGTVRGSISVFIRDGRLFATWGSKDLSVEKRFETGLELKNGDWNTVSIAYDFRELAFRVNGAEKRFPCAERAWAFKPSIFGGHDKRELAMAKGDIVYFRGLLKRFGIWHNCKTK